MVNTIFNYTDIEKCKMQLQLNILIGEKNPELNWLTRPDPTRTISRFSRPDPTRPDPTRGWTRPVTNSVQLCGKKPGKVNDRPCESALRTPKTAEKTEQVVQQTE
jgi:hypothetical protein